MDVSEGTTEPQGISKSWGYLFFFRCSSTRRLYSLHPLAFILSALYITAFCPNCSTYSGVLLLNSLTNSLTSGTLLLYSVFANLAKALRRRLLSPELLGVTCQTLIFLHISLSVRGNFVLLGFLLSFWLVNHVISGMETLNTQFFHG